MVVKQSLTQEMLYQCAILSNSMEGERGSISLFCTVVVCILSRLSVRPLLFLSLFLWARGWVFSIKLAVLCELKISICCGQVYPDAYSLCLDTFRYQHQSNVWPWYKTLEMLQNAFYSDWETIIPPASTVLWSPEQYPQSCKHTFFFSEIPFYVKLCLVCA